MTKGRDVFNVLKAAVWTATILLVLVATVLWSVGLAQWAGAGR